MRRPVNLKNVYFFFGEEVDSSNIALPSSNDVGGPEDSCRQEIFEGVQKRSYPLTSGRYTAKSYHYQNFGLILQ